MYKENQTLKLKEEQSHSGLPKQVSIVRIFEDKIFIQSEHGSFESNAEILDAFYNSIELFTEETMAKLTIEALNDIILKFDVFASSQSPAVGISVKSKLFELKEKILRVSTNVEIPAIPSNLLGKKIA